MNRRRYCQRIHNIVARQPRDFKQCCTKRMQVPLIQMNGIAHMTSVMWFVFAGCAHSMTTALWFGNVLAPDEVQEYGERCFEIGALVFIRIFLCIYVTKYKIQRTNRGPGHCTRRARHGRDSCTRRARHGCDTSCTRRPRHGRDISCTRRARHGRDTCARRARHGRDTQKSRHAPQEHVWYFPFRNPSWNLRIQEKLSQGPCFYSSKGKTFIAWINIFCFNGLIKS